MDSKLQSIPEGVPKLALEDSVVTVCPYFKLNDAAEFKKIWKAAFDPFAHKDDVSVCMAPVPTCCDNISDCVWVAVVRAPALDGYSVCTTRSASRTTGWRTAARPTPQPRRCCST
jgi:hypothetical protein